MGKKSGLRKPRASTKAIVFDEGARKDFLTGFSKRKKERRQHARQKLAVEVRNEKLSERAERRDAKKKALGIAEDGIADDDEEAAATDSDDDDGDAGNAETAQFVIGDTLTTTTVESIMEDSDDEEADGAPQSKRTAQISWMGGKTSGGASSGGASSDDGGFKQRVQQKKFDLSQPLASVIPGYKAPVGLKKKKKVKKRKLLSKKDKQKHRAPERRHG